MNSALFSAAALLLAASGSSQDWEGWYADAYDNPMTDVYTATMSIRQAGDAGFSIKWMCAVESIPESGDSRVDFGLLLSEAVTQRERPNQTPVHYRVDSGEARTVYASRSLNGQYLFMGRDRALQMFREISQANSQIVFTINQIDYYTVPVTSIGEAAMRFSSRCPLLAPEPY